MSLVYILLEDGRQTSHEEVQIYDLLERQILTPHTLFWREGMAEWRPLTEFLLRKTESFVPARRTRKRGKNIKTEAVFQARFSPLASEETQSIESDEESELKRKSSGRYYLRYNPIPLVACLQILLASSIIATAFLIYQYMDKIHGWSGGVVGKEVGPYLLDSASLTWFFWVVLGFQTVAEIMFLWWIFQANKNSRGFASNMFYTPGWAVVYFFIPVVNLFRPYQVVQEIWKISENPLGWIGRRDSIFVGCWFLMRLGVFLLEGWAIYASHDAADDPLARAMGALGRGATVEIAVLLAELITFLLVSVVTWRQIRWAQ